MRTFAVVADCIAMKDGSDARVSIKHRIGLDDNKDYSFVRDFVETGCRMSFVLCPFKVRNVKFISQEKSKNTSYRHA